MTSEQRLMLCLMAVGIALLPGCGDSKDEPTTTSRSGDRQARTASAKVPPNLEGTYTVRLHRADMPHDAPPELIDGGPSWRLTISSTGGVDGAASFAIASAELGYLESATPTFASDQVTLHHEECAASGDFEFFDNVYTYELEGSRLSFNTVSNRCADKIAETILTRRAWTKQK